MASSHLIEFNKSERQRARAKQWCKTLNSDPEYRLRRGWLTESQKAEIAKDIAAGRRYIEIAADWLVVESVISRIAKENGLSRACRAKNFKDQWTY